MQAKQVQADGQQGWVLVFDTDDELMSTLQHFAREHTLSASHFSGIGAFRNAVLGYFEWDRKDYKRIPIEEQVEVVTLTGFITESDQAPSSAAMQPWAAPTAPRWAGIGSKGSCAQRWSW